MFLCVRNGALLSEKMPEVYYFLAVFLIPCGGKIEMLFKKKMGVKKRYLEGGTVQCKAEENEKEEQ